MKPSSHAERLRYAGVSPIGGLMDPRFKYTPAVATDLRATFARIRAEQPLPLKGQK